MPGLPYSKLAEEHSRSSKGEGNLLQLNQEIRLSSAMGLNLNNFANVCHSKRTLSTSILRKNCASNSHSQIHQYVLAHRCHLKLRCCSSALVPFGLASCFCVMLDACSLCLKSRVLGFRNRCSNPAVCNREQSLLNDAPTAFHNDHHDLAYIARVPGGEVQG
jgi:hypothetical protein